MKQRSDKGKPRKDRIGEVYDRLTIIACAGQRTSRAYSWRCRCTCGRETTVSLSELRKEHGTKSCGCLRNETRCTQGGLGKAPQNLKRITLKNAYKITPEQVEEKRELQNNSCAICKAVFTGTPYIDHDHSCCPQSKKTCGKCVRGLLCRECNLGLGNFQDNPQALQNAILYLAEWTQKLWQQHQ